MLKTAVKALLLRKVSEPKRVGCQRRARVAYLKQQDNRRRSLATHRYELQTNDP